MKRHRFAIVLMLAALVLSFIGCQQEVSVTGNVNVSLSIEGCDGYTKAVVWGQDASGKASAESLVLLPDETSGVLTLPAGEWTLQASVMKGNEEIASGSVKVKVIPNTTVNASIKLKGNVKPDVPVEGDFKITSDEAELEIRSSVNVTASVPEGIEAVNWYINGKLSEKYTGKSVWISSFDLILGNNTIKASYVKDGAKFESNEVIVKLKDCIDVKIEYKLNSEGKPAVTFTTVYLMTEESKAELLAQNPTYKWKVGMGGDSAGYKEVMNSEDNESIEYVLESSSVPIAGASLSLYDKDDNLLYSGYNSTLYLFDSIISVPETIKQGEEFTAKFTSQVLVPDGNWSFRWMLDGKSVENGTGENLALTVNDGIEHTLELDVIYDGCTLPLYAAFKAEAEAVDPDVPVEGGFKITSDKTETITRSGVDFTSDAPAGVTVNWYINGELSEYTGQSVWISGFKLNTFGNNTIKASYIKDGVKIESNEVIIKLNESLDVAIEFNEGTDGTPVAVFSAWYHMTEESKAELLAKNPTFRWTVGMGNDTNKWKVLEEHSESVEYKLEKTSDPCVGAILDLLDSNGKVIISGGNSRGISVDYAIKLPEKIIQEEPFTAEFTSGVLDLGDNCRYRWTVDGIDCYVHKGKQVELYLHEYGEHEIAVYVTSDGREEFSVNKTFTVEQIPFSADELAPSGSANIRSPLPLNSNLNITINDWNPEYQYYALINGKKIPLNDDYTEFPMTQFGYGKHTIALGNTIDGKDHNNRSLTFMGVEGASIVTEIRGKGNVSTAVAKLALKDGNPHKNKALTYKWEFQDSTAVYETAIPEIEIPSVLGIDTIECEIRLSVYDGNELLFTSYDFPELLLYENANEMTVSVPSTGTFTYEVNMYNPYFDLLDNHEFIWPESGMIPYIEGKVIKIPMTAAYRGKQKIEYTIKDLRNGDIYEECFLFDIQVDEPVVPEKQITLLSNGKPLSDTIEEARLGYYIDLTIAQYDAATTYKVYYDGKESTGFKNVDGVISFMASKLDSGKHTFRVDGLKDGKTITGKTYTFDVTEGLGFGSIHPKMNADGTVELSIKPLDETVELPTGGTYTWIIWDSAATVSPITMTTDVGLVNWTPAKNRTDGSFSLCVDYLKGDYKATTTICSLSFLPHLEVVKPTEIRVGGTYEFSIVDTLSVVDPDSYAFEWKLNGKVIEGVTGPKASIKVSQEGNNDIEISYYAQSDKYKFVDSIKSSFTAAAEIVIPETRDFNTWYGMVSGCLFGTSDQRPGKTPDFTKITPEELQTFERDMKTAMASNPYGIEPVLCHIDPDTKDFSVEFDMNTVLRYVVNQRTDGSWYGYIRLHQDNGVDIYSTMDLSGSSRTPEYLTYWNKLPSEILNGPILVEMERVWNPDDNPAPERGIGVVLFGGDDVNAAARKYADVLGAVSSGSDYLKKDGEILYRVFVYENTVGIDVCDYIDPNPDPKYSYRNLLKLRGDALSGIGKMPTVPFKDMSDTELRIYKRELALCWREEMAALESIEVEATRNADGFNSIANMKIQGSDMSNELHQDSRGIWTDTMRGLFNGQETVAVTRFEKPEKTVVLDMPAGLDVSAYGSGVLAGETQEMITFCNVTEADAIKILERYSLAPEIGIVGRYVVNLKDSLGFGLNIYVASDKKGGYGVSINYEGDGKPIPEPLSISLNITDSIEPLVDDDWLTAASYRINAVGSKGSLIENTVSDISNPVVLGPVKFGEDYEITVSALNGSDAVIGTGSATAKLGDPAVDIVVSERKDNGKVSVVLNGFTVDAAPTVKYGSSVVKMTFESGAWKGLLDVPAGKQTLVIEASGFSKTLDVRVVSGRTTDVMVSRENGNAEIVVENNITKTPEIVISELQKWDPETRTFKLSAAVPGYPKAAFTWKLSGNVKTGKETTWQIPTGYSGYIYVNVVTKCGDLFVSCSYELKI